MSDQLLDVLNALIKLELKIGELYESCARRWPEDDQFWLEVAHQEAFHARVIERMSLLISNNPAHYVPAKVIHVAAVNTIISGIDRKMELLRIGQLLKVNALTIAIDLEESVMEKKLL